MHLHFVCTGNVYRSRFAETYIKSKKLPNIIVSSSGTQADKYSQIIGPVAWESMRFIKNNNLVPFLKPIQDKTTSFILSEADKVIFFSKANFDYVKINLGYDKENYEIWEIADVADLPDNQHSIEDDVRRMKESENTLLTIKQRIDIFLELLKLS